MPLPSISQDAMVQAMQQFRAGQRSPQGPKLWRDWLSDSRHHYVLVGADGEPYPVKEIIRLAVWAATGAWPPEFWGGPMDANKYARRHGFTVVRKDWWLRRLG